MIEHDHRHLEERQGPGRWTPTRSPRGVLWTDDETVVGYQPGPLSDGAAIDALIEMSTGTPTEVFDDLAARVGTDVLVGDLGTWKAAR
ncbi:MAG: hypothetical protein INR66_14900 [Gordonia polyisoprenivorans]|nr:hypothetical protein [Gordonia polyisoprenivorans]